MSGDFQSSEVNAKNNHFIYEVSGFQGHSTIGFRTALTAPSPTNGISNE